MEINDNELLYLVHEGNEKAYEIIIDKYKYFIVHILNDLTKNVELVGMEKLDLYQEGLIGLISAIKMFDENKETSFYTYAMKCIKNKIFSAIRLLSRKKSMVLNNSYSLDKILSENNEVSLYGIIKDDSSNPNKLLMEAENEKEVVKKLYKCCSSSESDILKYKLMGLSNKEISKLLDKDKKSIENSLFRINKKYKELLAKEH